MPFHSNEVEGSIHKPNNWSFANAAAREGATGLVASDVDKFCIQEDNNSVWMLTNHDPVTWKRIDNGGSGGGTSEIFVPMDPNANEGNYRSRDVGGTGSHRFNVYFPTDFASISVLKLIGICSSGAAGSGKDIDLFSDYCGFDEDAQTHQESDTTTTYDFTGKGNKRIEIDLSGVFSVAAPGDVGGVFVDHNGIGGSVDYLGIKLVYNLS